MLMGVVISHLHKTSKVYHNAVMAEVAAHTAAKAAGKIPPPLPPGITIGPGNSPLNNLYRQWWIEHRLGFDG